MCPDLTAKRYPIISLNEKKTIMCCSALTVLNFNNFTIPVAIKTSAILYE